MKRCHWIPTVALGLVGLAYSAAGGTEAQPAGTGETVASPQSSVATPRLAVPHLPRYPSNLLRKGVSGYVLVQFRLDDDGKPRDARVVMGEPKGAFDRAVLLSVSNLRFDVPQEWIATHPNRILDFGYVFVIEGCVDKNLFPGISSVIVSVWRSREAGDECLAPH